MTVRAIRYSLEDDNLHMTSCHDRSIRHNGGPALSRTGEDLHLWFPREHSLKSVERSLRDEGISYRAVEDGSALVVQLGYGELAGAAGALGADLSREAMSAVRALVMPAGVAPGYRDFGRVMTLRRVLALAAAGWLIEMLGQMQLTAHFQSIVYADAPGRRFGREGLLRGLDRNGALYAPGGMFQVARDADLLVQLDLAARRTIIGELDRNGRTGERAFINVTPAAIHDPTASLRSTVDTIDEAGIQRENIIFEIAIRESSDDPAHVRDILSYCREAGFGVALDGAGPGSLSPDLIDRLRPDYIKLGPDIVRGVDGDPYNAAIAGRLLEVAGALGIEGIAVGVENTAELTWLRNHGAAYIQGYLIDRPGPLSE